MPVPAATAVRPNDRRQRKIAAGAAIKKGTPNPTHSPTPNLPCSVNPPPVPLSAATVVLADAVALELELAELLGVAVLVGRVLVPMAMICPLCLLISV